ACRRMESLAGSRGRELRRQVAPVRECGTCMPVAASEQPRIWWRVGIARRPSVLLCRGLGGHRRRCEGSGLGPSRFSNLVVEDLLPLRGCHVNSVASFDELKVGEKLNRSVEFFAGGYPRLWFPGADAKYAHFVFTQDHLESAHPSPSSKLQTHHRRQRRSMSRGRKE